MKLLEVGAFWDHISKNPLDGDLKGFLFGLL